MLTAHKEESIEQVPFSPWPYFEQDEIDKVTQVLASGKVNYWTGDEGRQFEVEFARAVGCRYAVAVMNGTVALEAAFAVLGIGPGDEVITTSRTFIATASSFIIRGATPVFADVDIESQNITAASIAKVLTLKTKAIIVVHLGGWPCEMASIVALAKQHQLYVIEDCAQAIGATIQGKSVGSWGDIAAFSFCQDKIMTTGGEGGMVTTNNEDLWSRIWSLKDHGKSFEAVYKREHPLGFRWLHESFGTNWRMTEMQAAIGRIQLMKLEFWIQKRIAHAALLDQSFKDIPALRLTIPPVDIRHVYYKYYVFLRGEHLSVDWNRERIMQAMHAQGVPCYSGICSEIYLERAFTTAQLAPQKRLPIAEILGKTSLMFLVHPTLTEEHMVYTARVVKQVFAHAMK